MEIKNLTLSFGTQDVFKDINLNIEENEKIGIVGVNGAGKTTFFKVILGFITPDKGIIKFKNNARKEWLPQVISEEVPSMDISVFDYLLSGRPLKELNDKLQQTYKQIATKSSANKVN